MRITTIMLDDSPVASVIEDSSDTPKKSFKAPGGMGPTDIPGIVLDGDSEELPSDDEGTTVIVQEPTIKESQYNAYSFASCIIGLFFGFVLISTFLEKVMSRDA